MDDKDILLFINVLNEVYERLDEEEMVTIIGYSKSQIENKILDLHKKRERSTPVIER